MLRDLMCRAGTSDCFTGFTELQLFSRQANAALQIGERHNEYLWHYMFSDFKLEYLMAQITSELKPKQIVHTGLMKLMEYDRHSGMNYVESLREYIGNQFNASVSAERLFIHRSTFLRRLERIVQISGINLADQDEVLYLMISMKLIC